MESEALTRYLAAEQDMLACENPDNLDPRLDAMDPLWYALSEDELQVLDARP